MLSIEHVTKKFGSFTALEDLNLTFDKGVYGLLAPNGAGKTTLLKLLTTLLFPTSGSIRWDGREILTMGGEYRGKIGYLPQEFGYYKNDTPRQFLSYMGALQCMDRGAARARIEELLDLVGLSDVKNKKLKQFSGGMLQRVGIAQAMLNEPEILILDEPTAGLDPKERVRFRNLIHSLSRDRIVILSTHIVSDIAAIAGEIIMLKDHRVLCCKSPSELCAALRGSLYEVPAGEVLPQDAVLLSETQRENGPAQRIVTKYPPASAAPAAPDLEDVFLYVYSGGEMARA